MKKIYLLLLLMLSLNGMAQSNLVKGSKTISLKYGGGKYSIFNYYQSDVNWCYREKLMLRGSLSYEKAIIESTALSVGRINIDHGFNMFDLSDRFYFNAIAGGYFGFEASKSLRNPLSRREFVFGAAAGLEADVFLSRSLSLKVEFLQYYMQNSAVSPWFYTGTVGVSYVFN